MKSLVLALVAAAFVPAAAAASREARCEKYHEELVRIDKAKAKGGSEARLHKLEAKRQKILAAKAKHHC